MDSSKLLEIRCLKSNDSTDCKDDINYPKVVDTDTIEWHLASEPPLNEKGYCPSEYVLVYAQDDCDYSLYAFAQYDEEKKEWKIVDGVGVHSCIGFFPLKSEHVKYWCFFPVIESE